MKNTTISKPSTEAHQEALESFEQELARIDAECGQHQQQIPLHQAELATFAERGRTRQSQQRAAQEAINNARTAYTEAQLRAELLPVGELSKAAQKELGALEKQLRSAQDAQMKLLSRHQQEADVDGRRQMHLQEAINAAQQTMQRLNERKHTVRHLRDKAFFDQGEAALNAHLDTVKAMEAQRDQQRAILASMEQEITAYVHRASQDLASFPDQLRAFTQSFVFNDSLTALLSAQIDLIDLVLTVGNGVQIPSELARKIKMPWANLPELLSVPSAYWRPALAKESWGNAELLQDRKRQLRQLLDAYRDSQAESEVSR